MLDLVLLAGLHFTEQLCAAGQCELKGNKREPSCEELSVIITFAGRTNQADIGRVCIERCVAAGNRC